MVFETASTALILGLYVGFSPAERRAFWEIRHNSWPYAAVTGIIIMFTYGLVLVAMAYVTQISYLAAFRELSIPIGALLGITLQKEPAPAPKNDRAGGGAGRVVDRRPGLIRFFNFQGWVEIRVA